MEAIIRKDTGEDWRVCVSRLVKEEVLLQEGGDATTDEELRRFGPQRAKHGEKEGFERRMDFGNRSF